VMVCGIGLTIIRLHGENRAESFGIYSGDARVKKSKADAPPLEFLAYPTRHSAINHKLWTGRRLAVFWNFVPPFP
jgi:hypothetical protein